ncbi:MAG: hypothetical protein JRJ09_07175 [Deltaproteobacteria bacterium]|nr:hypothetical protein [Deltaproteobacteria bacterium]HDZ91580.1 hypothetical protein [Deltaproteobacteria bacterium]
MFNRTVLLAVCLSFSLSLSPLCSCTHARPPKPGPDFVWVAPHRTPDGRFIKGHWKHTGTPRPGKVWVPGHYSPDGTWVPGHWKKTPKAKPGGVWVPGHYGPGGRWVPGHWK